MSIEHLILEKRKKEELRQKAIAGTLYQKQCDLKVGALLLWLLKHIVCLSVYQLLSQLYFIACSAIFRIVLNTFLTLHFN